MARCEPDPMAGLRPEQANRTPDLARADNADVHDDPLQGCSRMISGWPGPVIASDDDRIRAGRVGGRREDEDVAGADL